jgi:hypothetical protein
MTQKLEIQHPTVKVNSASAGKYNLSLSLAQLSPSLSIVLMDTGYLKGYSAI